MNTDEMCKLIVVDGKHLVTDPNGNILSHQFKTVVVQDIDEAYKGIALIRLTMWVKLEDTKK
jgi:hypothetical protein